MRKYFPSYLRRRLIHPLQFLQETRPSKTCQYRCCSGSSGQQYGREHDHQLLLEKQTSSSSSLTTFAIPTALLGLVGAVGYLHYNDERRAFPKGQGGREGIAPSGPTIGGPFTLIDTSCKVFTDKDLRGKWVLLYFGYTSSPEIGPSKLQKIAKTIDLLESKHNVKVLPIFATLDPQRDTPSHLREYLREFDSRILGLTGTPTAVKEMAQEYRVFFRKVEEDGCDYLVESSHNTYLINPNLEIVRSFMIRSDEKEMLEGILEEIDKSRS